MTLLAIAKKLTGNITIPDSVKNIDNSANYDFYHVLSLSQPSLQPSSS